MDGELWIYTGKSVKLLAKQGQLQIYLDMKGGQLLCNCKMPHTTKEN